ncbi:hypothetical protein CONPUDRAFT_55148, partial [Coniophora puteana RWD-64-598 SS2]
MRRLEWQTPWQVARGEVPDVSKFRVFGCGAYVFLPEAYRKDKLDSHSKLMTYIGNADGGHGWKFMRRDNSTFIAAHAVFNELMFPRCAEQPIPQATRIHIPAAEDLDHMDPHVTSSWDPIPTIP